MRRGANSKKVGRKAYALYRIGTAFPPELAQGFAAVDETEKRIEEKNREIEALKAEAEKEKSEAENAAAEKAAEKAAQDKGFAPVRLRLRPGESSVLSADQNSVGCGISANA